MVRKTLATERLTQPAATKKIGATKYTKEEEIINLKDLKERREEIHLLFLRSLRFKNECNGVEADEVRFLKAVN